jgi:hypothetical protein
MQRSIRVLSDVCTVADLLAGGRIESMDVAAQRGSSTVSVVLKRPQIEAETDRSAKRVPVVTSTLVFRGVAEINTQPAVPQGQVPLVSCEAVPGGYVCALDAPPGQQTLLKMPALEGFFQDQT